ncbi:MAG: pimeloyl-ACP methyl ester carboxylesterase [Planctomycetota bacterium]
MSLKQTEPGNNNQDSPGLSLRRRLFRRWLPALLGTYLLLVVTGCCNPSTPVDWVMNLPPNAEYDDLRVDENEPTLVILQHGIWRSSSALWRLERSLEEHGYEVLNSSYPSTRKTIEEHAALLEKHIEKRLAGREDSLPRLCFVGHSMGGLVIRSYLQRPGARRADTCVFLGTPHRGASLADAKKETWWFPLVMGDKAALQLSPSSPFYTTLGSVPCAVIGTIIGGQGDDKGLHAQIPGDDDGTVGVSEAHLPEETDSVVLKTGHTRLSFTSEPIRMVLRFLKLRAF